MKDRVVRAVFAAAVVVGCGSVFATDYTWRGGGADANWSTAENWSPNGVPTKGDNVIFDAQSTGTSSVDEGLATAAGDFAAVNDMTLKAEFGGTIQLRRPFAVQHTYTQENGTMTCGEHIFRSGVVSGTVTKPGNFYLHGGTFNAPSTEFQYYSASHQVYFESIGGTWNHNNGTFIIQSSCNGGNFSFKSYDRTYNNFILRRTPGSSWPNTLTWPNSTNTVLGDLTIDVCTLSQSKSARLHVKGDITVSGIGGGGDCVIVLDSDKDQYVHGQTSSGKCWPMIVDKPAGRLIFDGDQSCILKGAGYSQCGECFRVKRCEGVDMSGLSTFGISSYASSFYVEPGVPVTWAGLVKITDYNVKTVKLLDQTFNSLYIAMTDSRMNFGTSTNTVLGDLTVSAGGFIGTDKGQNTLLRLKGNYHVDNKYNAAHTLSYGGGNGWVVLDGETDQTITCTNAGCNSIRIDKPEGCKVLVDSPDNCLWLGHAGGYVSGDGSFDMRSGILDVSQGGIIMTNCCYGTLKQTGGTILWGERGLYTYIQNGGHSYTVNFGDFMIPRYEAAGAKGGTGNINGTVTVSNFVNNGTTFAGTAYVYGDHYVHADTKARVSGSVRYCGDADQRVFAEEGASFTGTSGMAKSVQKTGGTLTLDSDLKVSSWDGDSFAISDTSSVDMNGHTLETPGDISLTGRAMFSGAAGQLKAGRTLYFLDKGTIAFNLPTEPDNVPFLYGKNVYFNPDNKPFTNTVEVLSKAREDSVSPVHLIATAGTKFYNSGAGGFNREPVWQYVMPFNIRKPKAVVSAAEGKLDFTWKLKHGLKVLVR